MPQVHLLTYTWSPATGLYTNPTATTPYIAGTQTGTVYAAPTTLTTYTVSGTNATTGCVGTTSVVVNYTPPAPTITPAAVSMCLGDAAVRLTSSTASTSTASFTTGPISVAIPDNTPTGATSTISVTTIPATATVTAMKVTMNVSHSWIGDVAVALKAPNGNVLSLDYYLSATGGSGATTGFTNTVVSSTGTAALSSGTNPWTGTFRADGAGGASVPAPGPTGFGTYVPNFSGLYSTPNGIYTLGFGR